HRLVEACIGKGEALRVHLQERLDATEPPALHAFFRLCQHLARNVDSGNAHTGGIERQRQAAAYANLDDALAGTAIERADREAPAVVEAQTEDGVVERCE